jgi:hypothetical protein
VKYAKSRREAQVEEYPRISKNLELWIQSAKGPIDGQWVQERLQQLRPNAFDMQAMRVHYHQNMKKFEFGISSWAKVWETDQELIDIRTAWGLFVEALSQNVNELSERDRMLTDEIDQQLGHGTGVHNATHADTPNVDMQQINRRRIARFLRSSNRGVSHRSFGIPSLVQKAWEQGKKSMMRNKMQQ